MNSNRPHCGFTLIELLIVVAIIAILAAIAVPNFLEAQTRSKVSRVKSDLRVQTIAIEAYVVDHNRLPRDSDSDLDRETALASVPYEHKANGAIQLTTPIAYMTTLLVDPFSAGSTQLATGGVATGYRIGSGTWSYDQAGLADGQNSHETFQARGQMLAYVTFSPGIDRVRCRNSYKSFPFKPVDGGASDARPGIPSYYVDYDPTNGTVSGGDIYHFGGQFMAGDWDRNGDGAGPAGPATN